MTANRAEYKSAAWVIENNARIQATGDATTFDESRLADTVMDPMTPITIDLVLAKWRDIDPKAMLTLKNVSLELYNKLSDEQIDDLIELWCNLYKVIVLDLLKERFIKTTQGRSNNGVQ